MSVVIELIQMRFSHRNHREPSYGCCSEWLRILLCCCVLQAISLEAAGRVEELDQLRSDEGQLLKSMTELSHTEGTLPSISLDLNTLCTEWAELRFLADEKAQLLSASLSHWNLYQSALSRLMPCLDDAEQYVSAAKNDSHGDVITKTGSLAEAQKLVEDHQVII